MRKAILALAIAALPLSIFSCSLFTSLDGLQSSDDAGTSADTSIESSVADSGADTTTSPNDAAVIDSGLALLSCDADGLVAYWPMDEGSGLTITDCHQFFTGVLQGGTKPTWGTRADGGNVEFSNDANIQIAVQSALELGGPFTVAGWFRSDALPGSYASLFWSFDSLAGFEITASSDGTLYAQVGVDDGGIRSDFPALASGTWAHLTMVFEPGVSLRTYFNGARNRTVTSLEDGDSLPNLPASPNNEAPIIGPLFGSAWTGGVDDLRIFSRALSDDEIAFLAAH